MFLYLVPISLIILEVFVNCLSDNNNIGQSIVKVKQKGKKKVPSTCCQQCNLLQKGSYNIGGMYHVQNPSSLSISHISCNFSRQIGCPSLFHIILLVLKNIKSLGNAPFLIFWVEVGNNLHQRSYLITVLNL